MSLINEAITFFDDNSGDEATVIVRNAHQTIGLCLSLKHDGDIEVFLPIPQAELVLGALQKALVAIKGEPN
jgi:hypothetical protein